MKKKTQTVLTAPRYWLILLVLGSVGLLFSSRSNAFDLPLNFEKLEVVNNLNDPDGFAFSPDGRMFISERITGRLLVAKQNPTTQEWELNAQPFYTFDIPKNDQGEPEALRSAGLRDITFDPDFANNGFVYAFYMKDDILHNRVVRLKASAANPDIADLSFGSGGEQLLIELPFNDTTSSGSHNGGAVEFGNDGNLYITTGDGWEGEFAGDPVQSLETFTGKVFRINPDGTIPTDNPFYNQTTGSYRAIYALGLRNPYSMSRHTDTGELYINEARGVNKADIYLVEASANYQHEGSGIGNNRTPWANGSGAGGELITGGAWYPTDGSGSFPINYWGAYFIPLWGSNTSTTGQISYISSKDDTSVFAFETSVGLVGSNGISVKPVITRIGPDGNLYYMLTTYTTSSGAIHMVRYTAQETVSTPVIMPVGGNYTEPIQVSITTDTVGATIHYTTNGDEPTIASTSYSGSFTVSEDTLIKAKAFKEGLNPSSTASVVYIIGEQPNNQPPIVDAGPDKTVFVGETVALDGSGTTDPDGNDDFLTGEQWTQLSGPSVEILDATEEIAYFTPEQEGIYEFRLEVSDGIDVGADEVTITAVIPPRVTTGLAVLYTFNEGEGTTVYDVSGVDPPLDLEIATGSDTEWLPGGGLTLNGSSTISGADSKITSSCQATNEVTIEAWIKPENITQDGPARIVSLSADLFNRNFTLGQEADRYDVRLRTTDTNDNGILSIAAPSDTVKTDLSHVVLTRDASGAMSIYVNSVPQVSGTVEGNFSNWNNSYTFLLGNELTGDRSWLGEFYLVAIYCQALDQQSVLQNYLAGTQPDNTNLPEKLFLPHLQKDQ